MSARLGWQQEFNRRVVDNCRRAVEEIAKFDQQEWWHRMSLSKDQQERITERAVERLLTVYGERRPEDVLTELCDWHYAQRTEWLASEEYVGEPADLFEDAGYKLAKRALNTARAQILREDGLSVPFDEDKGAPSDMPMDEEGAEQAIAEALVQSALAEDRELRADELAVLVASCRLLEEVKGRALRDDTALVIALLAAAPPVTRERPGKCRRTRKVVLSERAIERLTGINRHRVAEIFAELKGYQEELGTKVEWARSDARKQPAESSDDDHRGRSWIDRAINALELRRSVPGRRARIKRGEEQPWNNWLFCTDGAQPTRESLTGHLARVEAKLQLRGVQRGR